MKIYMAPALLAFLLMCCQLPTAALSQKEDVTFSNGSVTLAGTLQLPKGRGPFPAVVFLHGSGPSDRHESKQRAGWFLKKGYAVLTYDKRGVGASQGTENDWRYYNFDTLAADAVSALEYLTARSEVNDRMIGLVAASQSGWVVPLVAKKYPSLSFMIIISASVCTVAEDNLFERSRRLKSEGFGLSEIAEVKDMHLIDNQLSRTGENYEQFALLWEQNKDKSWFTRVYLGKQPLAADHPYRLWYRSIMDYEPQKVLAEIDTPILWIYGDADLDRFAPIALSLKNIGVLKASGKPYSIQQYAGADHNLKGAKYKEAMFQWILEL
ncbi:MAG: alpha/beta hydrolase [Cyclobacteriaceae bacterium]|nr:alpha/beta hydrolase [Cyclobacteriaceae bacterium]